MRRRYGMGATLAAAALVLGTVTAVPADATPGAHGPSDGHGTPTSYTVTVEGTGGFSYPTDTPASPYIDKDGTFYFQQSASLYGANDPHYWQFFTGTDLDTARPDTALNNAADPANPADSNDDTVWRCNNSPTGQQATADSPSYPEKNYCDLVGVWVDPDTGDWYGLVHNEFTGRPFGDGLHYDAIDVARSTDQGKVWTIFGHAITSPYSTVRGDTAAFPEQTYYYGDGDPRLYVDTASGYFYVYYGSRVVNKGGSWVAFYSEVARAPMSGKMAPGSWHKFYDGGWSQPGSGGQESNLVPVTSDNPRGYTPPSQAYSPANPGTAQQQIAAGTMPPTSPLFVMNITYDAYLGLYLGSPQAVDQSGNASQQIYATKNLADPKWFLLGDTGSYHTASWYRWFLDPANRTSSTIVGKSLRNYCSIACDHSDGQYVELGITSNRPAPPPVDLTRTYRIATRDGQVLAQVAGSSAVTSVARPSSSDLQSWYFLDDNDGSYSIFNARTHAALGVDSTASSGRAWGAEPTVAPEGPRGPTVGQQWWLIANTTADGSPLGSVRLVNRYSGLVLAMPGLATGSVETTPVRSWTDSTGSPVGAGRSATEQIMTLSESGPAPRVVSTSNPGDQTWTQGQPASLQIVASSPTGHPLQYSATGLPAGLTIDKYSGLISGTPTAAGIGTATVSARAGNVTDRIEFDWMVQPDITGDHTVTTAGGHALQAPSDTAGVQLTVGTGSEPAQTWTFQRQADGSYALVNMATGQCMDDNGGFTDPGTWAIQWPCTGGTNQHWKVVPVGGDTFTVINMHSQLLLTAASDADGAAVTQEIDNGSPLQHWHVSS